VEEGRKEKGRKGMGRTVKSRHRNKKFPRNPQNQNPKKTKNDAFFCPKREKSVESNVN
jgi:hypothetical protein